MSKSMHIIYTSLFIVLFLGLGITVYKTIDINYKYQVLVSSNQSSTLNNSETSKINQLQETIETQKNNITQLTQKLDTLSQSLTTTHNNKYMPAPEYAIKEPVFEISQKSKKHFVATGNIKEIASWQERNELFFEYVMQKAIPFEYDRRHRAIAITDIVPDSLFYQMGLRKGDCILNVDGQKYVKGMELRYKLIETKPKRILIYRDNKYITLDIDYTKTNLTNTANVSLDITQKQFNDSLLTLTRDIQTTPVTEQNTIVGLKITQMNNSSTFGLMNIKINDVIQSVNSSKINSEDLVTYLKQNEPLNIHLIRNNTPQTVVVNFQTENKD